MKIINAYWEKRNLGVDCSELEISSNDTLEEFNNIIGELNSNYQVVRIPSAKTDILLSAQAKGFQVIEMSVELARKTKDYTLPEIYKRFEPFIDIVEADEKSLEKVLNEIKSGNMFVTDRIAKDPYFSVDKSGNRYYWWSKDILNQGANMCIAKYNNENVGFGLNFTKDSRLYDAALGGIFHNYNNKGLGFLSIHANITSIILQGGIKVVTRVSSNNTPILRLHMLFGFDINEMNYILIKHI